MLETENEIGYNIILLFENDSEEDEKKLVEKLYQRAFFRKMVQFVHFAETYPFLHKI